MTRSVARYLCDSRSCCVYSYQLGHHLLEERSLQSNSWHSSVTRKSQKCSSHRRLELGAENGKRFCTVEINLNNFVSKSSAQTSTSTDNCWNDIMLPALIQWTSCCSLLPVGCNSFFKFTTGILVRNKHIMTQLSFCKLWNAERAVSL